VILAILAVAVNDSGLGLNTRNLFSRQIPQNQIGQKQN